MNFLLCSNNEIGYRHGFLAFSLGFFPFFSIAATNVVFFMLIIFWASDLIRRKTSVSFYRTPFDLVFFAFIFVWVLAGILGLSPLESLQKAKIFQHLLTFYILLFSYGGRLLPYTLCGLGAGAGINVLYGWGQFLLWDRIYNFAGGERPEWFSRLSPNFQRYLGLFPKDMRIHGALHLMTYSELLLPPFFFCGARILERGKMWLSLLGFALSGGALVLVAQRGPLLGGVMGLALILFMHPRRWRLVAPVLIFCTMVWVNPVSRLKLETISSVQGMKENHRVALWKGGLYIFSRHPFFGVGPGQIKRATEIYKGESDFPPNPKGQEGDLHNFYLQRLVEMGVPGFIVACWLLLIFLKTGHSFYLRRAIIFRSFSGWEPETLNALALGTFASFFSFLFINLTERSMDDAEVALVFWMLAAVSVWLVRESDRDRSC